MAMQHMPRPWLLAALADVPVIVLAQQGGGEEPPLDLRERALPRPEPRRRRLSSRRCGNRWYGLEAERVI
jgi:hypothetical protein